VDLSLDFCLFPELCGSSCLLRILSCLIYTVVQHFYPNGWMDEADGWKDGWMDREDG